jgi:prepilin-type N-terminal cleavage/methylation domain-containing protein
MGRDAVSDHRLRCGRLSPVEPSDVEIDAAAPDTDARGSKAMENVAERIPARGGSAPGFTLIELCAAMSIFGILAAISVNSLHGWMAASRQTATTSSLEALLRETQQRAVTEGRTLCVDFDLGTQTWAVLRGTCGTSGQVSLQGPLRPESGVRVTSAAFATGATTLDGVTFFPRGTAAPGSLTVTRSGSSRTDTLRVDGLTGRVSRG